MKKEYCEEGGKFLQSLFFIFLLFFEKIINIFAGFCVESPGVKRKCSDSTSPSKRTAVEDIRSVSTDDGASPTESFVGLFAPLHLVSVWTEPGTTTKCVSGAIVLLSGVNAGDFTTRVREGGKELELTVNWPITLNDVELLHRKWLTSAEGRMEKYHPKYLGFENALKSLRERITDRVESTAHIVLPFLVETHIKRRIALGWHDSTRVI